MAIPDLQSVMLPLLQLAADGRTHKVTDAVDQLADRFGLSVEERQELVPSGRQARFSNRVAWARSYLKHAGLLENPGRGEFRITQRGRQVLANPPPSITIDFLMQFPEFVEFREGSRAEPVASSTSQTRSEIQTPEEILESSYQTLRQELAEELVQKLKQVSPQLFESFVVDLLVAMGYGGSRTDAGRAVGRSGDGGIDGIINEDRLGLDVVYLQAKRWDSTVGRPLVQAFAGSLEGHRARKGVMITTSQFSQDALEYVRSIEKRIVLIDGQRMAELMIDYGVGVTEVASYTIKKVDLDYFGEG